MLWLIFPERLLAAQNPLSHADRPHQLFADAPPMVLPMAPPPPPPVPGMGIPPPGMPPMGMSPASSKYTSELKVMS